MEDIIGIKELEKANRTLRQYRAGKAALEQRVVEAEQWWKLRHNELPREGVVDDREGVSAWLFNTVAGKHADACDAYPQPVLLPREENDRETAKLLSRIVPCILEQSGFEEVWSDIMWQKLRQGTGIYKVVWDKTRLGGLGDVSITRADVLNLFWEPGVDDIQKSENLFHVELRDRERMEEEYPQLVGKGKADAVTMSRYLYDDRVDTSRKCAVVDWYYRKNGVLHYCKYVDTTVLFATENDPAFRERGWYDHGKYPFVFDRLFPTEGTPCGFGYVDVGKHAQDMIDRLGSAVARNALMAAEPRYFVRGDGAINEEEFTDWTTPIVHVNGNLGADSVRQITVNPVADVCVAVLNNKIEELKFTAGNLDVANGDVPNGVTAAAAIAALQETAGKLSRDANRGAYRAFTRVVELVLELIRQFYTMPRTFRVAGEEEFVSFSSGTLAPRQEGSAFGVELGESLPVFDIRVSAAKRTAYSAMSQNETAIQFFRLGFFEPGREAQALMCIEMMDFDGKEQLMRRLAESAALRRKAAENDPGAV